MKYGLKREGRELKPISRLLSSIHNITLLLCINVFPSVHGLILMEGNRSIIWPSAKASGVAVA